VWSAAHPVSIAAAMITPNNAFVITLFSRL